MATIMPTVAFLDAVGRFVSNIGVPAAITFFLLSQITPRLDEQAVLLRQSNTQLTVLTASCASVRFQQVP